MATMEEKKLRQLRLFNDLIFGFAKGLYDLFGDSALATVDTSARTSWRRWSTSWGWRSKGRTPRTC